jgi:signal transduction histidine kinase
MLQSEKMASIGQLAAGVAHEINNPTGFVSSNLKTLSDYHQDIEALFSGYRELVQILSGSPDQSSMPSSLTEKIEALIKLEKDIDIDYVMEDLGELIKDCRDGTNRIKKIVLDLKDFAHPGEDKIQSTDINKGLESTLNVVNNELKYKAKVHKDFGDIPTVYGYPQQLNQVFMNILVNAGQAIENRGEIYISTSSADGYVEISIRDTGCGIPEENLNRIFDPFFTTKDVGKGTGLGMNIAYNIIKKHNGTIDVQSTVGQGTTFTICIPSKPADGTDNKTDSNLMQREIEKEQDGGA